MRRKLNWKVLGGLVLVLLLLGASAWGVYRWQSQRTAETLLEQSHRLEGEDRFEEAAGVLANYLAYRPKDNEQRARMGLLLERAGTPKTRGQAIEVFARVLRAEPDRTEVRRRLVDLALELERFGDARPHLADMLSETPDDASLEYQLGRCAEAAGEHAEAAEWYEKACRHDPQNVESHSRLAGLLRRKLNQPEAADQVLGEMLEGSPESFRAHLARARHHQQYGSVDDWEIDIRSARELAGDEPDVLLACAEVSQSHNDLPEARRLLNRALERTPKQAGLYRALAGIEMQAGRPAEAVACLRRGLDRASNSTTLLEPLAEALIDAGNLGEARETIERLNAADHPAPLVAYLEARCLLAEGKSREAKTVLESARPKAAVNAELAGRIEQSLGQCQDRLGNPDKALECYRKAVALNPRGLPARLALVAALMAHGRLDEGLAESRRVAGSARAPSSGLTLLARGLIRRNLQLPASARKWDEVDTILEQASRSGPQTEVTLLRAQAQAARGQPDAARAILEEARDKHSSEVAYWVALIDLNDEQGKPEQARSLLKAAREKLGDRAELQLARIRQAAVRPGSEGGAVLAEVARDLEKLPEAHQRRVLAALAEARHYRGEVKEAGRLWQTLAARQPYDLAPRVHLFDLALRAEDRDTMRQLAKSLREIEGDDGTFWRFAEATLLVLESRRGGSRDLAVAREHLQELTRRRPHWSRTALLAAAIDEAQGDFHAAAENYQRAIGRGDDRPEVVRRLVELLTAQGRYPEAAAVVRRLSRQQLAESSLSRLAAEVSLRVREADRAIELARQSVSPDSTESRDHLWLGQLLSAAGKTQEAETSLRRAIALDPANAPARVALVEHLARAGKQEQALAALDEARAKLSGGARQALARCHEALGQFDSAEKEHLTALADHPHEPPVQRGAAEFYLRIGQPQKAEPLLRTLADPNRRASAGERAWARRSLAVLLAQSGGQRQFQEALVLTAPPESGMEPVEDVRARAHVLSTRPGRRADAIRLFRQARNRQPLPEEELFLLAKLFEQDGNWPSAQEALNALADLQRDNPQFLAYYARSLIRRDQADQARAWVRSLEKLEPNALLTVEVKARLLKVTGKEQEAVALVLERSRQKDAPIPVLAGLLEELGCAEPAETLYRAHAATATQPEAVLILAAFLGRQRRLADALDIIDRAWKSCKPESVSLAAVAMLRAPGANASHFTRVEQGLTAALEKQSSNSTLLLHLATLRDLQGRYDAASEVYRRILARESGNVIALNNLSWLLAHREDGRVEALKLVDRAIDAVGPLPALLDTRGVAYLNLKQTAAAIRDFEKAVADEPTPARLFHLAHARFLAEDPTAAEALRRAKASGLKVESLHPLERETHDLVVKGITGS